MSKHARESQVPSSTQERVYAGTKKIDHDLFELLPTNMKKNSSWNPAMPNWELVVHQHFFHTFDSSGRKLDKSESVGGHFHLMEVVETRNSDGSRGVPIVKCSGPMRMANKRGPDGRARKVAVPLSHDDNHVHEIRYMRSDKVDQRVTNIEANAVVVMDENRVKPVPGVIGD